MILRIASSDKLRKGSLDWISEVAGAWPTAILIVVARAD
jgi:hypothetical protein